MTCLIKQTTIVFIFLVLFSCCKKKDEPCLTCAPPVEDTTSHVIQWQAPDTLGVQGLIRDVWVFDRNNALAVGQIFLADSIGRVDNANPYGVAQWNGQTWQLKKIYDGSNQIIPDVRGIYSFSSTDIWLADGGVYHWYGNSSQMNASYSRISLIGGVENGQSVNKLWGTSSNNLYGVGYKGMIAHFNGSSWTKMTSNTTVDLQDIWGIDATHIWATGTNVSDGHCVVLQCNGTSWTTLYDSNTQLVQPQYQFGTLWTNNPSTIYLDGGSGTHKLTLNNLDFGSQIKTGLTYVGSRIRGVNQNDIFDVTTGGEVAHYNGSSWYCYTDIQAFNKSGAWFTRVYPTSNFVLIGGWYLTAYNSAPIVIRGYR